MTDFLSCAIQTPRLAADFSLGRMQPPINRSALSPRHENLGIWYDRFAPKRLILTNRLTRLTVCILPRLYNQ